MGKVLGLCLIFVETTVRIVSLLKQLAGSTAEISRRHVVVHGKWSFIMKDLKVTWNK
jgi:hypothetical protein